MTKIRILRERELPTHHDGPPSEKEAAALISATKLWVRILTCLRDHGPSIAKDIAYDVLGDGKEINNVSGSLGSKRNSLEAAGLVRRAEQRSRGRYGLTTVRCIVWEITTAGREWLAMAERAYR